MKIRSLKLKQVHERPKNGLGSYCSIIWDQKTQHLITSSSSDTTILIHDYLLSSDTPKTIKYHRDGVTSLALSTNSTCLASGSIDHSAKLYKFPSGEFETNITRFVLPIRTLGFNNSGSLLAAAGDDEGIKLINTIDGTIARVLKAHKGSVTGIEFDPIGDYLASVDSIGTVIIWELQSGKTIHILKGIAPDTHSDASFMNVLVWSPDAEILAVPGLKNDVVMYDRDTAEKKFSLRGDHVLPVCFLSWSPNGKYMATSSLDKQVLIWDVDEKQDIDRQKFDDRISCMAWKSTGNALAVIDVMGRYGVWESVISSSMKSPTEDAPNLKSRNSSGLLLFDEDDQEPSVLGSLSDIGEHSLGEFRQSNRKRLRKQPSIHEYMDEDIDDELRSSPNIESHKRISRNRKESLDILTQKQQNVALETRPNMQEAFQQGATPVQTGKRRFLCYNMLGSVTSMDHDDYFHIEIDFHDTSKGPRIPSMTDYFGFTMASLNENGCVFANPCKGEKNMSTLMYRPFSSWANNSEWSMRFENEEVKVVALGFELVAAVTSLNYLRFFTEGGMQKFVVSLDGPVVTMAFLKYEVAVVTHASHCIPSNDQMLNFRLYSIHGEYQKVSTRGHLPMTPGSSLIWFGISEEGQLSSYDSKGVLRVFTDGFGGSWLPVFSHIKEKRTEETYWVVGLNARKLICVVCKSPELFPQVIPKPVLTLLDFSIPLASSDLGAETFENEFILIDMKLVGLIKTRKDIEDEDEDDQFNLEAAQDRCILRLIASCCNGDKLVRALELAKLLSLDKSLKAAIKLVTTLKLPSLAERFNALLEERLCWQPNMTEVFKTSEPVDLPCSSTKLSTPLAVKTNETTTECNKTIDPIPLISSGKLTAPPFVKKVARKEVKRVEVANPGQPQRPSNPFAKTLTNQEKKSSLFDSMKVDK